MTSIPTLLCLLAYAPVRLPLVATSTGPVNETPGTLKLPGIDHWECDSSVSASVDPDAGRGRVRGRACGVSNWFENFRSVVGAEFSFRFLAQRDHIVAGEEYHVEVDVLSRGQFRHFPAVPSPGDQKQPPARTSAHVDTRVQVHEVNNSGGIVNTLADSGQILMHNRVLEATAVLENTVLIDRTEQVRFQPSGQRDVLCRVTHNVLATAAGSFSDIRIRGADARNFEVEIREVRIARVLQPGDPCFRILNDS